MRYSFYFFCIFLVLFMSSSVLAQGDYLKRGESGIEADFGYLSNKLSSGYGGQLSICTDGFFDIGIAMTWLRQDAIDYYADDIMATSYSAFFIFHLNKQNRYANPIKMSLLFGFVNTKIDKIETPDNQFVFGFIMHRNDQTASTTTFQPWAEVMFYPEFGKADAAGLNPAFGLGFSLIFDLTNNNSALLRVGPSISIFEKATSYAINFGLIVPFDRSEANDGD